MLGASERNRIASCYTMKQNVTISLILKEVPALMEKVEDFWGFPLRNRITY